jgi:hypothetical protein
MPIIGKGTIHKETWHSGCAELYLNMSKEIGVILDNNSGMSV